MQSCMDTLEDKQAKALREIYKMCKTDDGVGSEDSLDDQDYLRGGEYSKPAKKIRSDSQDSEKMKQLFN